MQVFYVICHNFVGKNRTHNYAILVDNLLFDKPRKQMQYVGKGPFFLHSYGPFFTENVGIISHEHGKRFYQAIVTMEKRYMRKIWSSMLAEFCWSLHCKTQGVFKRKSNAPLS